MIVYRELSSLAADLGFSAQALYSLSNHMEKHYRLAELPKANGELRRLWVPDSFLMAVQRSILRTLLVWEEVSPYATAYRFGGSPQANARPHVGQPQLLKLDIRKFFDHLYYPLVKEKAFPSERYSEPNRILLTLLCTVRDGLPQGAPTSPAISNLILKDFDNRLGAWCGERRITYTRYCDDMAFSGAFDAEEVIKQVREELRPLGLFLNERKTVRRGKGQRMQVTGLVVNQRLSVPASYRRKLRQELYYCRKYGVREHGARTGFSGAGGQERTGFPGVGGQEWTGFPGAGEREQAGFPGGGEPARAELSSGEAAYLRRLLGQVRYVLSVDPGNREMKEYAAWLEEALRGR